MTSADRPVGRGPSATTAGRPWWRRLGAYLSGIWTRRVRGRADFYAVYLKLPTSASTGDEYLGAVADLLESVRLLSDGRVDVTGRDDVVVETDPIPRAAFDRERFEALLDAVEQAYGDAFSVRRVETWKPHGDGLLKSYIVAPVRPLVTAGAPRRSPAD